MAWAAVAGAGISAAGSLLGGGSSPSGQTTSTQSSEPWSGVKPYLLGSQTRKLKAGVTPIYGQPQQVWQEGGGGSEGGGGGQWVTQAGQQTNPESDYETTNTPGIYSEAQNLYSAGGWNPAMAGNNSNAQSLLGQQQKQIAGRDGQIYNYNLLSDDLLSGRRFDPSVSTISGAYAQSVNPANARASQGALDPTAALQSQLSGQVTNPYLTDQVNNITAMLTRNTNENVLPGVRGNAMAAGQYGGSRQGIAEGLAASRLNQDIASAALPIYGQAYESAQQRQYGVATGINQQAADLATANANRDLTAAQFNTNVSFQNQAAKNAAIQQQLQNRMTGLGVMQQGNAAQDANTATALQNYGQQQGLLGQQNAYNWQNLGNYAGIIQPGTTIGGTQTSSQPYYTNPMSGIMGGALAGKALGGTNLFGGSSGASNIWNPTTSSGYYGYGGGASP